jgi:hypothetical protein
LGISTYQKTIFRTRLQSEIQICPIPEQIVNQPKTKNQIQHKNNSNPEHPTSRIEQNTPQSKITYLNTPNFQLSPLGWYSHINWPKIIQWRALF